MRRRRIGGPAAAVMLILLALLAAPAVRAQDTATAERIAGELDTARRLGAKGNLPNAWWDLDARFKAARENGASPAFWEQLELDARRLANAARFVDEMRQRKSGLEAMLGRFDQALAEVAALQGVEIDPTLSGSDAAADLLARLTEANLRRQVLVDSLRVANRNLTETVGGRAEALEATVTELRVELSALRQKLWETELRAGVAEADRSAAETVLTRKQQREQAIAELRRLFGPDEAEIVVTAEGAVVMRLFGVRFGVGSASLSEGQDALVGRIAEAVGKFPGAAVALEGHTDDTGGRDANLRLSRRRAESVARQLEGRLGLGEGTIATEGFGPDRPVALNSTPEGRARNRRIDVVITPGS